MTAAARQRLYRHRQRAGRVLYTVEVANEIGLLYLLTREGFLTEAAADNREAVTAALEAFLNHVSGDA